jgi:hypothetical protein
VKRVEFGRELIDQGMPRELAAQHLEARLVVVDLASVGALEPATAAQADPQLAGLRDLVGGEYEGGPLAGLGDLLAQGGPAASVVVDRGVVAHGRHQLCHLGSEAFLEVAGLGVRVLEHVVQHAGGHHLVGVTGLAQKACGLDGVRHEGDIAIDLALLSGVTLVGEREGLARERRALQKVGAGHHQQSFESVHEASGFYIFGGGPERDSLRAPRDLA